MWNEKLAECARAYANGALTTVEPSGYPVSVRCNTDVDSSRQVITFPTPPSMAATWQGKACLLFHRHNEVLENFHELVIKGELDNEGGVLTLHPADFLTGTGRQDSDRMPHAAAPLPLIQFMMLGRRKAREYLAKRGQPWPPIQFDPLVRAAQEVSEKEQVGA